MNKNNLLIALSVLACGIATAFPAIAAQTVDSFRPNQASVVQDMQQQVLSIREKPSFIQIGGNYTYVTITPNGLPSFRGNLGGAQASYEYQPLNAFYGAFATNWKQGATHGANGKQQLLYVDVQERLGYTVATESERAMFTFFTGLGYRHLGHKLTPTLGPRLSFRYNEFYVPVGVFADFVTGPTCDIGVDFTWMPQVYPTVSIVPTKGARWALTETLKNFSVALPLDFTLTKSDTCHLVLKPFYEYWKDGHTKAATSTGIPLGLPSNTYDFWGVDVNFGYCF